MRCPAMILIALFGSAIALLQGVHGQCGSTTIPSGTNVLQSAAIYNQNDIYRVSVDSLTSSGYTALATSGKAQMATADQTMCPLATCMMELATNQRAADQSILQQSNFFFGLAPLGYTLITPTNKMYCVKFPGDCGANVPLWRYTKSGSAGLVYAYSFDKTVAYTGYTLELLPVCYTWSTTTTVSTCGDGISASHLTPLASYKNSPTLTGANVDTWFTTQTPTTNPTEFSSQSYTFQSTLTQVAKSMSASTDAFQCNCLVSLTQVYDKNTGFLGSAMAPGLGSRFDHKFYLTSAPELNQLFENYQPTGEVFYCVSSKGSCGATVGIQKWFNIFTINTVYTIDGQSNPGVGYIGGQTLCYTWPTTYTAPTVCAVMTAVTNGQITYTQASTTTSYLSGTVAQLTCNSGSQLNGAQTSTCLSTGVWSPTTLGTCSQGCAAFATDPQGSITYSATTYSIGTTATLACTDTTKYAVKGVSTATCTASGTTQAFSPNTLGPCTQFCAPASIPSITVTYFLSDGTTPATQPYFEGYKGVAPCPTTDTPLTVICTSGQWVPSGTC